MRHTAPYFIAAALLLFTSACSNDQREPSFVSEAQAATNKPSDYVWKTPADFSPVEDTSYDYS